MVRSRVRALLPGLILLISLGSQPAVAGTPADVADGAIDPAAARRDAVRIRTFLGFPVDSATVEAALADRVTYPSVEYGTPMTLAEAAEVSRRIEVQNHLEGAVAELSATPGAAGFYLDHADRGAPVFLIAGDPGNLAPRLRAALPAGTEFRVESATYSERDLLALQAAIEEDRSKLALSGVVVISTGLDTPKNRVIVGVDGDLDTAATVLHRYGDALEFRKDRASVADACTYSNCWLPEKAKGGIHVYKTVSVYPCTSGFMVRRPGTSTYGIMTAGHCIEVNGGYGQTFKHGTSTVYTVGTSRYETWAAGWDADAGIIDLSSGAVPTPKNTFHVKEGGVNIVRSLNAVTSHAAQSVGLYVCRSGLGTGASTCGHVVYKNVTRPSCVGTDCRNIDYQFEVDFDSTGGDSGGPIYANNNGYGLHVHSDPDNATDPHGWYSSLEFARSEYYRRATVTYNFCLLSDCSVGWPY